MSGVRLGGPLFLGTPVVLSDTSATAVVTGANGLVVNALRVSNENGGSVNVTIDLYDVSATTAYNILPPTAVSDDDVLDFGLDLLPVPSGFQLRVTANSGVTVFHTFVRDTNPTGSPGPG